MKKYFMILIIFFLSQILFIKCAAFRSDIKGLYNEQLQYGSKAPVRVFFDFYHYTQSIGRDVIPKLLAEPGIDDFDDVFHESMKEISNIKEFATYNNLSSDIDNVKKRNEKKIGTDSSDYVIKIEILRKNSFSKHVLGNIVSTVSLDLIPIGYTWNYIFSVSVFKKGENLVGKYVRSANVTNWNQILLIVVYPFHPEERKNEEIYLESLINIFKQIENENILK